MVLVRADDVAPGDIVNFLLTAALYKAKAHGKAYLQPHSSPWWREAVTRGGQDAEALSNLQSLEKRGAPTGAPFPAETGLWVNLLVSSKRHLPFSPWKKQGGQGPDVALYLALYRCCVPIKPGGDICSFPSLPSSPPSCPQSSFPSPPLSASLPPSFISSSSSSLLPPPLPATPFLRLDRL